MKTAEEIYRMYILEGKEVPEIAEILRITERAVYKTLKKFPEYTDEKEKRKTQKKEQYIKEHEKYKKNWIKEKREKEKDFKNQVIDYFFANICALDSLCAYTEEKAALHFNIPLHQVYDILSKDKRYEELEKIREMSEEAQMNRLHQIEVNLTVKKRKISERLIFETCKSAYEYDKQKDCFVFTEKFGKKPAGIKKYYKVHTNFTLLDELKNKIEKEKQTSEVERKIIKEE
ncbi:helix-turn-helix domain-containing protein [Thermoanaerobacter mathranii]|uniref:helix-turn-helix domain-containing protein n=1 Tax=Thermoanaerobacter mathranii TaxID=583357 RepID=UPI003D6B110E